MDIAEFKKKVAEAQSAVQAKGLVLQSQYGHAAFALYKHMVEAHAGRTILSTLLQEELPMRKYSAIMAYISSTHLTAAGLIVEAGQIPAATQSAVASAAKKAAEEVDAVAQSLVI